MPVYSNGTVTSRLGANEGVVIMSLESGWTASRTSHSFSLMAAVAEHWGNELRHGAWWQCQEGLGTECTQEAGGACGCQGEQIVLQRGFRKGHEDNLSYQKTVTGDSWRTTVIG